MAEETVQQAAPETARKLRQEKVGRVTSTTMQKTIVVEVNRRVPHPLYRREVQVQKKFYAHDEKNECQVGDIVRIVESRPLSRLKRWRLAEVVRRAKDAGLIKPSEIDATLEKGAGPVPATKGTGTEG
jgi:small subunit ribosomal protein S17